MTPLAEQLRPTSLDNYIGQTHLVGKGAILRNAIESGKIPSMILWGPPGIGKTTRASIISKTLNRPFHVLSAISSGVKDVRAVIDAAENAVGTFDRLRRKIARDDDLTPRDIANGVQALGDAMIAGGQFDRRLGTAGALTSAVGLRVGQVLRWFEDRKRR